MNQKAPWNKGKLIGQKPPLKPQEVWAIRIRLQLAVKIRNLALFKIAIDSKLRGCDLMKLRVGDVCHGPNILNRTMILQQKTKRPVQFELTEQTRNSLLGWIRMQNVSPEGYLFPSRINRQMHISTRQYARIEVVLLSWTVWQRS